MKRLSDTAALSKCLIYATAFDLSFESLKVVTILSSLLVSAGFFSKSLSQRVAKLRTLSYQVFIAALWYYLVY